MGTRDDVLRRIEEIEGQLRDLGGEVEELRALVVREPQTAPSVLSAPQPSEAPVVVPPAPTLSPAPAAPLPWKIAILQAREQLAAARPDKALDDLERAISTARADGDRHGLEQLARELKGIARYRPQVRERAHDLAREARSDAAGRGTEPPTPADVVEVAASAAAVAPAPAAPAASRAPAAPTPPRRGLDDLARDWELLGPRGFAVVGGAVTALGIILLFVLAANRGWITPGMRVVIGAFVSAVVLGAGIWVRARYGQLLVSVGAVGAGVAGLYATLAAAAARYDLVPDGLALPLAAVIAAIATAVAIAWSSEILAAIGLLGAALAPALQAIDVGMTWASAAFALIILAAAIAVSVPKRWRSLLAAVTLVVCAQTAWLVADQGIDAGSGTIIVAGLLVLTVLAAGLAWQITLETVELDAFATSFLAGAVGLALVGAPHLFETGDARGLALAAAAGVWAVAWAVLRVRRPAVGLVLGVSSLTLAAVATADLLSGTALAVAWAAQSILFAVLAWRLLDARLQLVALAYGSLAAVYALGHEAPVRILFEDPVDGALAVPVAAVAAASLVAGLAWPERTEPRTETDLLAWLAVVRAELAMRRAGLQELLVCAGVAVGSYAAALALVGASFREGHLAATIVATVVGAVVTAVAARRHLLNVAVGGLAWLAAVLLVAVLFDVPEFSLEVANRSYGGWALLAAATGLLAGAFAFRIVYADEGAQHVFMVSGIVSLVSATVALGLVSPAGDVLVSNWLGWRLLACSVVYLSLSASVFRSERQRDLASVLWALGVAALLEAEWLLVGDPVWRSVVVAATAAALAVLARPLHEERLWLAGWGIAAASATVTSAVMALLWADGGAEPRRDAIAALGSAAALLVVAALAWRRPERRDLVSLAWGIALVALVLAESFLVGGGRSAAFVTALTGGAVAVLAAPLRESRLWWAGAAVTGVTTGAVLLLVTPPTHFLAASENPAAGLWVLGACLIGGIAIAITAPTRRLEIEVGVAVAALYAVSLGILGLAERTFGGSTETDFDRGHVAVSTVWSLVGLALLVVGLARGSAVLRFAGLLVFGLSLAKIFLYDLSSLSSVARALSFIAVGALVLVGGFFLQRLSADGDARTIAAPRNGVVR